MAESCLSIAMSYVQIKTGIEFALKKNKYENEKFGQKQWKLRAKAMGN